MAGPWEKYASPEAAPAIDGAWSKYGSGSVASEEAPALTIRAKPKASWADTAIDVAKSAGTGLVKGAAALPGMMGDLSQAIDYYPTTMMAVAAEKMGLLPPGKTAQDLMADAKKVGDAGSRDPFALPTSKEIIDETKRVGVPFHEPETTPGRFAETAASFVPGAFALGGGSAGNLAWNGVIPGLASEGAGQLMEQAGAPAGVQAAARIIAPVGVGIGRAIATAPSATERSVANYMGDVPANQREAVLNKAEQLFQEARQAGIPLTRANAVDAVTHGATNLSSMQRVLEGQGQLRGYFAPTEQGVASAGQRTFDSIAPASPNPSTIGPQVGAAAESVIGDVQSAINRRTRPLYQAAEQQRVGPQVQQALVADPVYARALQEVRGNPELNATIAHLPDDAVGVIDLVQRRLRERATNAQMPGQADTSNLRAANLQDARTAPITAAEQVTGGPTGSYATARNTQAALRQQYLEPLLNGPLGKLSKDTTTQRAIEALFPANPVVGSAGEVMVAVRAVAARNPMAARQLVRAHLEGAFNEATQRIQAGPNQWGGANFAAAVRGNRQQAENLAGAIAGLPKGNEILQGVDRFLNILEATAYRQHVGSQTAFNAELLASMKTQGVGKETLSLLAGAGMKFPERAKQAFERWSLGRNADALAQIITDPNGAELFRRLAQANPGRRAFYTSAAQIGIIGDRAAQSAKENVGAVQ